ncbi:PepSY domain-containing protein [Altererythrobacter endophyticus]|uniref:PepSY domain-containing protein n=2 Tax=Altericroceibacterium endophyticum TaxID=1808508 RepID=A0A6I4T8V9_9SPHN|nr:PepSY domain-containing protein [Altericroceibacterium endophyticum]
MTGKQPLMSRIPAGFVQAVLKGHSALGLAFAAAIYVVCLSGTLSVFLHEFTAWENPAAPHIEQMSPDAVQKALENAVSQSSGEVHHVRLIMPSADQTFLTLDVDTANGDKEWVADASGNLTPLRNAWSEFIIRLHIFLHLPSSWGIFIVGMTGVALLSSLISGLCAHPRIFRDAFHLRIGGSQRLQEADLHNRIGVWGLPFHIIVSLTGAFLGLTTIIVGILGMAMFNGDTARIYALFTPPEPVENAAQAPVLDLRPMLARLPAEGVLERITVEHPTEMGAAAIFDIDDKQALAGTSSLGFTRSAEIYYNKDISKASLGERVFGALGPLHFGWFGGGIVKIAYGLLGLGLTYLAVGGVKIWLVRRRDKGRPAPGWESVWAAVVWGQPAGLAAAALCAIVLPEWPYTFLIAVWGAITLAMLAGATVLSASVLTISGKAATAILAISLGLYHAMFIAGGSASASVWAMDVLLFTFGCGVALYLIRGSRRPRSAARQAG